MQYFLKIFKDPPRISSVAVPGIQNVILVGVGAGDDSQHVGLATGPELEQFQGKVALAWTAQLWCGM